MSAKKKWDGTLPPRFLELLPNFWAGRNSAGLIMYGVPGILHPVVSAFLEKAIANAFDLEGEALRAAMNMVIHHCRDDLAEPARPPSNWVNSWRVATWAYLNQKGRLEMGL